MLSLNEMLIFAEESPMMKQDNKRPNGCEALHPFATGIPHQAVSMARFLHSASTPWRHRTAEVPSPEERNLFEECTVRVNKVSEQYVPEEAIRSSLFLAGHTTIPITGARLSRPRELRCASLR